MSRTPTTLYIGTDTAQKIKPVTLEKSDVRLLGIDFGAYCGMEGTTISSADWAVLLGDPILSAGTETTGTKTTECLVTAADSGVAFLTVTTTFANGEVQIHLFRVEVKDPEREIAPLRDYQC